MTDQALPLTTFYAGWAGYQRGLVKVIAPLSPVQLALPAAHHAWSIGVIAQHIVANRVWWFQVWMGEGSPALAPIAHWDPADTVEQPALDAAALVAGLEATWQMIADALARWTAVDLEQSFPSPSRLSAEDQRIFGARTRGWILWHVLEHEIYHGGELSLGLGSYGLAGIYGNA